MEKSVMDLKSTAFGGFDKESVLRYLREIAEEHEEETAALSRQIKELQEEVEQLRASAEAQQTEGQKNLDRASKIVDAIQDQSKTLELLLEENKRLQNEVDHYRTREVRLEDQERTARFEAEAMMEQTKEECARIKRTATQEVQDLVQALEGKIGTMIGLSQEFAVLCRKGEQLVQRHG